MDFRVKKLILEEGMKNIADTEGVGLELEACDMKKSIIVEFYYDNLAARIHKECSYDALKNPHGDVFKTIEDTRREVQAMKEQKYEVKCTKETYDKIKRDFEIQQHMYDELMKNGPINSIRRSSGPTPWSPKNSSFGMASSKLPTIKNVIFNYPATIVFWTDGDKTVVKCREGDMFNPEVGLALAMLKKLHGNKGNYRKVFKPWVEKYETIYNACKHYGTLYFKQPCLSCLNEYNVNESSPNWEPKP